MAGMVGLEGEGEGAHDPEERIDAANAFRGWLDATGLLIEARPAR